MTSPPDDIDLLGSTKPGRVELRIAKYWHVSYAIFFLASGGYIAFLMWRKGFDLRVVLLMYGVVFLLRAAFAVGDSIHRVRAINQRLQDPELRAIPPAQHESGPWSNAIFVIGDLIILASVGMMGYALLFAKPGAGMSGVPIMLAISAGLLSYLIAVPVRIAGK